MASSFSTLSTNFSGALETGVDPRTGQFFMNLPLANINANHLIGPGLNLSLRYNTLSNSNINGFGKGVSLGGISFFNRNTLHVTLSNGESWPVNSSNKIENRRLKDCIFSTVIISNGTEQYKIQWKSGVTEYLSLIGGDIYATARMYSPIGKKIKFDWLWNGSSVLLKTITDIHTALCQFQYDDSAVTMTLWPQSSEECHFMFFLQDGHLSSIKRPVSDTEWIEWRMNYTLVGPPNNKINLLTTLVRPTGMIETIGYYTEKGLDFPSGSGLEWLPVVEEHNQQFGGDQPSKIIRYTYTSNNFLGRNANINVFGTWYKHRDYIYSILTDEYTYGSTATISAQNESVSVARTYNNYHFLISENTTRNGYQTLTQTKYYAEIGRQSDDQPAQYMLPMEKSVTLRKNNNQERTEKTITKFDEYGNQIYVETPDGIVTEYDYYPVEGKKDDCPAVFNGFVRYLRQKTITPYSTIYKDTPKYIFRYTYCKLGNTDYIVQKTISEYKDMLDSSLMSLMSRRTNTYHECMNSNKFGRISNISVIKYENGEYSAGFMTRTDYSMTIKDGILIHETRFKGYDGLRFSTSRHQSGCSGLILSETSAQGLVTNYIYDVAGRIIRRTICSGSEYENTTTWEYTIVDGKPCTVVTDAMGNKLKIHFDGAGRTISQHKFDAESAKWYNTSSFLHNSLGEVINGVVNDWLPSGTDPISLSSNITYGAWGEKKTVMYSDGRHVHQNVDLTNLMKKTHVQGSINGASISSGCETIKLDARTSLPIRKELKDVAGDHYSLCSYDWDGHGLLREEQNEVGNVTKKAYDEYGRVIMQTLPDDTVISLTYAPHLIGNQIASISVKGNSSGNLKSWLLGTQLFDSLGRLIQRICSGRTTRYTYVGASPNPSAIILPAGDTITYTYIPELGNKISSTIVNDTPIQSFRYNKKTGKMLTAQGDGSEIAKTWSLAGQLKSEEFSNDNKDEARHQTKYTYTLNNIPVTYTDISGKKLQYTMNSYGQLSSLTDDTLTVNFTYDGLGRVSIQTVSDKRLRSFLITSLSYDSFGRETTRTVENSRGIKLLISQTWYKNNLLEKRVTQKNGIVIRDEFHAYDKCNRLISYGVIGSNLPVDSYGHQISNQNFFYDALNNIIKVNTTLSDHTTDTATFIYGNSTEPTQLTTVAHTNAKYPATINLGYDANGHMISDETGRSLEYDAFGRLTSISKNNDKLSTYRYDAFNRISSQRINGNDTHELYYRGKHLVNIVLSSSTSTTPQNTRFIKNGHACLGIYSELNGLTLMAEDKNDSLLWTEGSSEDQLHVWSPYGNGTPNNQLLGFNGERIDPVSGVYHLGNGYRAYNPVLMRFNCPDDMSPFGVGGINAYAYCSGDPVNHTDPSGHLSWQAITGILTGVVGLGLTVFTAGASIAAASSVMAAIDSASATSLVTGGVGVVSDITGILSGSLENASPEASSILGWVSLGTGLIGMDHGVTLTKSFMSETKAGVEYRVYPGSPQMLSENYGKTGVRVYEGAWREPYWYKINHRGKWIYGADQEINKEHVASIHRKLRNSAAQDRKNITILTGTHGTAGGRNWDENQLRFENLRERDFYLEDMQLEGIQTRVIDTGGMSIPEYMRFIDDPNTHVILANCFGRNDEALRQHLQLPTVASFMFLSGSQFHQLPNYAKEAFLGIPFPRG